MVDTSPLPGELVPPIEMLPVWQAQADLLTHCLQVPAVLIIRSDGRHAYVCTASKAKGNPYEAGDALRADPFQVFYDRIRCDEESAFPGQANRAARLPSLRPDRKGLIPFAGLPVHAPDGNIFAVVCLLAEAPRTTLQAYADWFVLARDTMESTLAIALRNAELNAANAALSSASGVRAPQCTVLPVCSSCWRIQGEHGTWLCLDDFVADRHNIHFRHSVCPDCFTSFGNSADN